MNYNIQLRIKEIIDVIEKIIRVNWKGQEIFQKFPIPGIILNKSILERAEEIKKKLLLEYEDEIKELEIKNEIIKNVRNDFPIVSEWIEPYFFDESFMKEIIIRNPFILDGLWQTIIIDKGIKWDNGFKKLATHLINSRVNVDYNFNFFIQSLSNEIPKYYEFNDNDIVTLTNNGREYNRIKLNEILNQHYKKNLLLDVLKKNGHFICNAHYEKEDKEIPLTALLNSWEAIEKLPEFKDDLLCSLFAIYNNGNAIKYVGEENKKNEAIVDIALRIASIKSHN